MKGDIVSTNIGSVSNHAYSSSLYRFGFSNSLQNAHTNKHKQTNRECVSSSSRCNDVAVHCSDTEVSGDCASRVAYLTVWDGFPFFWFSSAHLLCFLTLL
jgi:hypothetical protein